MRNVRVYKTISDKGEVVYHMKFMNAPGSVIDRDLMNLANHLSSDIQRHAANLITHIDFKPFSDIEVNRDSICRRCYPLTKKETDMFWSHLIKDRN